MNTVFFRNATVVGQEQWLTSVIPTTLEVEIRRITI
jgi:hypothetical protein